MSNPQISQYLLPMYYESWKDSKKKHKVHTYTNEIVSVEQILSKLFPSSNYSMYDFKQNTEQLLKQVLNFYEKLEKKEYPSKEKPYQIPWGLEINSALFLYAICKLAKPEIVVETGVAYGLSSSYILQALYENKKGMLYSLDLINRPWQSKKMIGSIVPNNLRSRRKFVFGPTSVTLKKLLSSIGTIDIFLHDSLHTYKNMKREFNTAWPDIKKYGFLISDDVLNNNAFYEFHSKHKLTPYLLSQKNKAIYSALESTTKSYLGIIQKV